MDPRLPVRARVEADGERPFVALTSSQRIVAFARVAAFTLAVFGAAIGCAAAEPSVPEPSGYRLDAYNAPVPATLSGAKAVLSADEAKALMDGGTALFIDVYPRPPRPANLPASTIWRDPPHRSVAGAVWLANVGFGGLTDAVEAYFTANLAGLTGGHKDRALVFFCLRDCWMSWNAAKRAIALGYTEVYWFSEGTDAWEEAGYPVTQIEPIAIDASKVKAGAADGASGSSH